MSSTSSLEQKLDAGMDVHNACKTVGFLYVKNHGLSQQTLDDALRIQSEFFDLPQDEKDRIRMTNSETFRGYQQVGENVTEGQRDWHEAIDLMKHFPSSHPDVLAKKALYGPNQWPERPPQLQSFFEDYVNQLLNLGDKIMTGVALANKLPIDYFKTVFEDSFWVMRLLHYPRVPREDSEDKGIGCGIHTDYGFLTFVNQDANRDCLQVRNSSEQWVTANPIPGTLVVNIGDMMRLWSNGLYQSTPHRVQHPHESDRQSIAFFYEPGFDVIMQPEPKIDLEGRPPLKDVKPIMYGDHLKSKAYSNFSFHGE